MNWAILATGTIAAKFAETVNGMKGRTDWRPAVPVPGRRRRLSERNTEFPGHTVLMRSFSETRRWTRSMWRLPTTCIMRTVWHVLKGKHVLCEKPFTTNVKEGERLFAAAEERGLFIMEAFWIRHLPALKKMQELINGELSARWDLPGVISALWLKGKEGAQV